MTMIAVPTRSRQSLRLGVAFVFAVALAIVLLRLARDPAGWHLVVVFLLTTTSFLAVGLVITERRPRNSIGPLVLALGMLMGTYVGLDGWVALDAVGQPWAALGVSLLDGPLFLVLGSLFLVFPDGRMPSASWRIQPVAAAVLAALVFLGALLRPGPFLYYQSLANPLEPPSNMLTEAWELVYGLLVGCVALAALSLAARWRRADVVRRAQLKWVAFAALLVALAMVTYGWAAGPSEYSDLGDLSVGVTLGLFPVAIGVAVLRHRLYEIDRIISRSVSYLVITSLLAAVFGGLMVGLQGLLAGLTQGETLAVAASTLAVLALFQPVRRRVQLAVDRHFNRAQVDAQRTVDEFATSLRDDVDLDRLRLRLIGTSVQVMEPSGAGLWLRNATNS